MPFSVSGSSSTLQYWFEARQYTFGFAAKESSGMSVPLIWTNHLSRVRTPLSRKMPSSSRRPRWLAPSTRFLSGSGRSSLPLAAWFFWLRFLPGRLLQLGGELVFHFADLVQHFVERFGGQLLACRQRPQ